MDITIIGSGYVDFVSDACYTRMSNHVTYVDIDSKYRTPFEVFNIILGGALRA